MRILLGLTGSVASVLYVKLIEELQKIAIVDVILTEKATHFVGMSSLCDALEKRGGLLYTDENEWVWKRDASINATILGKEWSHPVKSTSNKWRKGDDVLHISLRDQSSALVIAPCSANTLAKITNGICDNLLTSVARAWDVNRPFIIAPSMNTHMWEHPLTQLQLSTFRSFSHEYNSISPQYKMLACKTEGMGALADISLIREVVESALQWQFPLQSQYKFEAACNGIPTKGHPGAFLTERKHHVHTGVDLYTTDGQSIVAVESGTVVGIEDFTGKSQQTPWWEDTQCILIEGASGVVCYGEMTPWHNLKIGSRVKKGTWLGNVKRVLPLHKARPDIDGHSTSMLHIEIYKHGIRRAFEEVGENKSDWNDLIDPTPFLLNSIKRPERLLNA